MGFIGWILIKYKEINFASTIKEMKLSLYEHIFLIGTSIIVLVAIDSKILICSNKEFIGNIILTAVLLYAINILLDTGKAVFVLIDEIQKLR